MTVMFYYRYLNKTDIKVKVDYNCITYAICHTYYSLNTSIQILNSTVILSIHILHVES